MNTYANRLIYIKYSIIKKRTRNTRLCICPYPARSGAFIFQRVRDDVNTNNQRKNYRQNELNVTYYYYRRCSEIFSAQMWDVKLVRYFVTCRDVLSEVRPYFFQTTYRYNSEQKYSVS